MVSAGTEQGRGSCRVTIMSIMGYLLGSQPSVNKVICDQRPGDSL